MPNPLGPVPRTAAEVRERPPAARRWLLARLAAGLTLAEAGRRAGVTYTHLCHIEHGRFLAGPRLAARLRAVYGMDDDQ